MARYIMPVIVVESADLQSEAFQSLQDAFPGWEPNDANLDVMLLQAGAEMGADLATTLSTVPDTIFRYAGRSLHRIAPIDPVAATGIVTFNAIDSTGYVIPAGTQVAGTNPDGNATAFVTLADATIAPGSTTVVNIAVQAVDEGTVANGVNGFGDLLDNLSFISQVQFTALTSGGVDGEDDETYLNRLRDELALQSPRPILPQDFATLARRIPGVYRAVAIDGLNPATGTTNNERMVTVSAVDALGAAVSSSIRNAVQADLDARREVNFVVNTTDPTFTTLNVTFTGQAWPDWDPAGVQADVIAAIQSFLSPATWGSPPNTDQRVWYNRPTVRYSEVVGAAYRVDGVRTITALTVNGGTADITLTGYVPLPQPGTVTGTITATTS